MGWLADYITTGAFDTKADEFRKKKEHLGPESIIVTPLDTIKTQKAQGYERIGQSYHNGIGVQQQERGWLLPQSLNRLKETPAFDNAIAYTPKWFARPCPLTPRHGFVESRPVHTVDEAIKVFDEARAIDPDAELLLVPLLDGKYSGIATNAGVSFGRGHDAVTAGRPGVVHIPTPMTTVAKWLRSFKDITSSLKMQGTGYVELVSDKKEMYAVQFRDGPSQPVTVNFIPKSVTVTKVLFPSDVKNNLLEWEELILKERDTPGVVVSLLGGALSSHFAVHAIAVSMPVITDHMPEIGAKLKAEKATAPEPMTQKDLQKLAARMEKWFAYGVGKHEGYGDYSFFRSILGTAIATIHAQGSWDTAKHLMELRSMAFPTLVRFIAAACAGEMRHWYSSGPGYRNSDVEPISDIGFSFSTRSNPQRWDVYRHVFKMHSIREMIELLGNMVKDFNDDGWAARTYTDEYGAEQHEYSFGGPKWSEAARAGQHAAQALNKFLSYPTQEHWTKLRLATNVAIHTVHNGGHTLTKWCSDNDMTKVANSPGYGLMNYETAQIVLGDLGPGKKGK